MSCEATRIYTSLSYRAKKVHDGSPGEFELIHAVLHPYYALRALKEAIYRMEWECELHLMKFLKGFMSQIVIRNWSITACKPNMSWLNPYLNPALKEMIIAGNFGTMARKILYNTIYLLQTQLELN